MRLATRRGGDAPRLGVADQPALARRRSSLPRPSARRSWAAAWSCPSRSRRRRSRPGCASMAAMISSRRRRHRQRFGELDSAGWRRQTRRRSSGKNRRLSCARPFVRLPIPRQCPPSSTSPSSPGSARWRRTSTCTAARPSWSRWRARPIAAGKLPNIAQDLALIQSMGVKVVLVHGFRPQVNEQLRAKGHEAQVLARHAHHRRSGARLRPGSRRPAALRDRGRLQPGPAEHADGRLHGARDLRQLHHRAAGRRGRRRRFPAFGPGAQGRCRRHPPRARLRRHGADVALRLLAHRRGLQPDDGRSRDQRRRSRSRPTS